MNTLYVLNDTHIGAVRSGGTTPASAVALRTSLLASFGDLLKLCPGDLIINGDLLDKKHIPHQDLWEAVNLLVSWGRANPNAQLYLPKGNHDADRNLENYSSFDLLGKIVSGMLPGRVQVITEPTALPEHNTFVVPHLQNQDLFDAALKAVPACTYLFIHANYDNKFAVESDHSLNLSPEQARAVAATYIVGGHEHQRRIELGGKVVMLGNQMPSSIADCLGNDAKYMLKAGANGIEFVETWKAAGDFSQINWRELKDDGSRFIRVQGTASAAEASDVVSAISKFRSRSTALVVTNAVKVEGVDDVELELSVEQLSVFDVRSEVLALLTEAERAVLTELLEE